MGMNKYDPIGRESEYESGSESVDKPVYEMEAETKGMLE